MKAVYQKSLNVSGGSFSDDLGTIAGGEIGLVAGNVKVTTITQDGASATLTVRGMTMTFALGATLTFPFCFPCYDPAALDIPYSVTFTGGSTGIIALTIGIL
jgi:hypothetical protein